MMEALRQTEKKYCSAAITTAISVGFILILAGCKPLAKGLISGTLFSIINFILIGETLPWRMTVSSRSSRKKSFFLALGSITFRYMLMSIPVVTALRSEEYSLWTAVVGIFMVQIMILADHLRNLFFLTDTRTDTRRKDALWKN